MDNRQTPDSMGGDKQTRVPEWEHKAVGNGAEGKASTRPRRSVKAAISNGLDSVVPAHRRYLGMSRKIFLCVLLIVTLALLALIIGLAVGLTKKSDQNLPLPSSGKTFTGDLTYYEAGLGACGETNGQSDDIVSISHILFDGAGSSSSTGGDSNDNPLCNKMLRASRYDSQYGAQRSVDLKVVDRCTGCAVDDLDTTLGAFEKLAPEVDGRVDVTWAWLEPVATGR